MRPQRGRVGHGRQYTHAPCRRRAGRRGRRRGARRAARPRWAESLLHAPGDEARVRRRRSRATRREVADAAGRAVQRLYDRARPAGAAHGDARARSTGCASAIAFAVAPADDLAGDRRRGRAAGPRAVDRPSASSPACGRRRSGPLVAPAAAAHPDRGRHRHEREEHDDPADRPHLRRGRPAGRDDELRRDLRPRRAGRGGGLDRLRRRRRGSWPSTGSTSPSSRPRAAGSCCAGSATRANDVSVVTNVSADHLGLQGIDTVDELAEVKGDRRARSRSATAGPSSTPTTRARGRCAGATRAKLYAFSLEAVGPIEVRRALRYGGRAAMLERRLDRAPRGDEAAAAAGSTAADLPVTFAGPVAPQHRQRPGGCRGLRRARAVDAPDHGAACAPSRWTRRANPGPPQPLRARRRLRARRLRPQRGRAGRPAGRRPSGRRAGTGCGSRYGTAGDRTDEILHRLGVLAAAADDLVIAEKRHYLRGRDLERDERDPARRRARGRLHRRDRGAADGARGAPGAARARRTAATCARSWPTSSAPSSSTGSARDGFRRSTSIGCARCSKR